MSLCSNDYKLMTDSGFSELSVRRLRARRRRLASALGDPEVTLRGALVGQGRRCSTPGCRCQRGDLHGPYLYLATRVGGRGRSIYVPSALATLVDTYVQGSARTEAALAEISQINLELLRRRALG